MPDSENGYVITEEDRNNINEIVRQRSIPFVSHLINGYKECRYINIARIKKFGILELCEVRISGRSIRAQRNVRKGKDINMVFLQPYLLDEHYMTGNYPETLGIIDGRARLHK